MSELTLYNQDQFSHVVKLSETLAKSTIVPMHFRGKPAEIFAAIAMGSEYGLQPMAALNAIVMIQGNATMKAQTMLAIVRAKCKDAIINISQDEDKKAVIVTVKRDGKDPGYTSVWDMNKAKSMGLASRDNWIKQPITMLRWRALSEALRVAFPDVLLGLYSTEEMEELPEKRLINISESLDEDFPIPDDEKICGDKYRIQNGKFRSQQLKDIDANDLAEYWEELESRKNKKEWEINLANVIKDYLIKTE